jgi:polar amino acid transport system permease protein
VSRAALDWGVVRSYLTFPVILTGLGIAIVLTIAAMAIGLVMGVVTAVMRMSKNPVTAGVAWLYVWVFRGTPVYLQLLMWFNLAIIFPVVGFPGLAPTRTIDLLTPFVAAAIGLGLNQGSYTSEVVRSGILSVDEGQTEAAQAIGMPRLMILRRIVLPQAMRVIIPPVGNEVIGMLKTTSLASAIGVSEILSQAQQGAGPDSAAAAARRLRHREELLMSADLLVRAESCTRASAATRCCAASTWRSTAARCCVCWARRGPVRAPCCAASTTWRR